MLKTALAAAAPNKVMIAGTGIESAHETLRLTEYAAELGYDAAMVRTPHYYKKQMLPANLLAFYRTVADRPALPIIIYNFPQATGYDIPAEVVIELASHPNIAAIKESSGNLDKVKQMVEGTRQVKRQVTVTETFEAVTPRMLKAAAAESAKESRELVSVASLAGSAESVERRASSPVHADSAIKTFILRGNGRRKIEDAPERSRLPGHGRRRSPTRTVACDWERSAPFSPSPVPRPPRATKSTPHSKTETTLSPAKNKSA